jgi:CRISPR-associated protein Cmr2
MQRDHYASRQITLSDSLSKLEQAAQRLDQAKQIRDSDERRRARQDAENDLSQAANQVVQIEPHLAYLWFEAKGSELDNDIRNAWQKKLASSAIPEAFHFLPDDDAIYQMPAFSFLLRVPFYLRKPYLSKDDTTFHLLDNPVRKERIFQVPLVAPTGWKGALRAALWQLSYREDHEVTIRLLGNPRESDAGQAGRLHFFATFFDKIGLEVINPHSRQSGVGERGPILIECVPQGTTGTLLLLYVPFGSLDRREIAQDLEVTAQGLQAMLTTYGFGAKTSSGFGVVKEELNGEGKLLLRAALSASSPVEPQIPENVQHFLDKYPGEDFSLKPREWREKHKATNRDQNTYKEARAAFMNYQQNLQSYQQQEAARNKAMADAPPSQPPVTERIFTTLSRLQEQARQVAEQLRSGGER